jgi:hypothetical protein
MDQHRTEMKQRREGAAHHLTGDEGGCVKRMIPPALFRVVPWQTRFADLSDKGGIR